MADEILPEGLRFFNKKDNQPDFVIGEMVISLNKFFAWAKANPDLQTEYKEVKQLKFQVKKSQKGNLYCSVNNWKPTQQAATAQPEPDEKLPF